MQSGKIKVFKRHELTIDMLMASACLPTMFKAVEVDGIPYWDGGYMGNPALFPFFDDTHCQDIVLVQINPIERKDTPRQRTRYYEPYERDHLQCAFVAGISRH